MLSLPQRLTGESAPSENLRPVRLDDLEAIRWACGAEFDVDGLEHAIRTYPDRSVWNPVSRELVVISPWRSRLEIASIREIRAIQNAPGLVRHATNNVRNLGAKAIVCMEWESTRSSAFYDGTGFDLIDTVVAYELVERGLRFDQTETLPITRLDLSDGHVLSDIVDVDNRAFPWIWWNNEAEFLSSDSSSGTESWGVWRGNDLAGYVTVTQFDDWGHIDRLAVVPESQGGGIGRQLLAFGVNRIQERRANRVVLSTQLSNIRSQSLYTMMGFRPTGENTYHIYGSVFEPRLLDRFGSTSGNSIRNASE